jgi:hypothetical protein
VIAPGAATSNNRNSSGGPLTSHLASRAPRGNWGVSVMEEHPRIMSPAHFHLIACLEQFGASWRGVGQQRFYRRAVGEPDAVYADIALIQQAVYYAFEVVLQLGQFAVHADAHLFRADGVYALVADGRTCQRRRDDFAQPGGG